MKIQFNFDWICMEILYDFTLSESFFFNYVETLPNLSRESKQKIDFLLQQITDDEEREEKVSVLYAEHYETYERYFPNRINYLCVVSLYSIIERNLKKICSDIAQKKSLPFSIERFEGSISKKLQSFIECFQIDALIPADIQTIEEIALLRNNIVHNNGIIEKDEKKISRFIHAKEKVDASLHIENHELIIERKFCEDYMRKAKTVFTNLFQKFHYRTDYTTTVCP